MYELVDVYKRFRSVEALRGVSVAFPQRQMNVVLGASGAGKSTLLRVLAGLEAIDAGAVRRGGVDITQMSAARRQVGLVTQDSALYPGRTVRQSIEIGLRRSGLGRAERNVRIKSTLKECGLEELADRRPHELSGGQLQRAALAKALAKRPQLLLLDEPFAQLDVLTKTPLLELLRQLLRTCETTVVMVSHDPTDAMRLADRIVVMQHGRVIDEGAPATLYWRPKSRESGSLMGVLGMNWIESAKLRGDGAARIADGSPAYLGFRPEMFVAVERNSGNQGQATRERRSETAGEPLIATAASDSAAETGPSEGCDKERNSVLWIRGPVIEVRDIGTGRLVETRAFGTTLRLLVPSECAVSDQIEGYVARKHLCGVTE